MHRRSIVAQPASMENRHLNFAESRTGAVSPKGLAVGYRKGCDWWNIWIAKHITAPKLAEGSNRLGVADDYEDADGIRVLSFDQAQAKAREWAADMSAYSAGVSRKAYTVGDACDAWLKTQTGTTAATHVEQHIRPRIGPYHSEQAHQKQALRLAPGTSRKTARVDAL